MSRFLPKSLYGQTLLILLAGLIISHAVGSWLYTADREQAVRAVGGFAAAQRIANLTRLVQDAPREWRDRLVSALSDQAFRVSVSAQPPVMAADLRTIPHRKPSKHSLKRKCQAVRNESRASQSSHPKGSPSTGFTP